jgi:hypothetical protein
MVLELEEKVATVVKKLKERGLVSPLKTHRSRRGGEFRCARLTSPGVVVQ